MLNSSRQNWLDRLNNVTKRSFNIPRTVPLYPGLDFPTIGENNYSTNNNKKNKYNKSYIHFNMPSLRSRLCRISLTISLIFFFLYYYISSSSSLKSSYVPAESTFQGNNIKEPSKIDHDQIIDSQNELDFDSNNVQLRPSPAADGKDGDIVIDNNLKEFISKFDEKKPFTDVDKNSPADSSPPAPSMESSLSSAEETVFTDQYECTKSFDGIKPVRQYVLMIDAGSTGSRIHVYTFSNCGPAPVLLSEEFKMLKPGLSSYPSDPDAAAHSLDELLQVALDTIPKDAWSCSPVDVKATAGLRLLGPERSSKILDAVRDHLENNYPFPVVSKKAGGVSIMGGDDEGVYAWITTNYLLGNIGGKPIGPADAKTGRSTVAVFDLGGGSTQIVFEPSDPKYISPSAPAEHRVELSFQGSSHVLYQHSHLGYGLMEARAKVYRTMIRAKLGLAPDVDIIDALREDPTLQAKLDTIAQSTIVNPCINPGTELEVDVKLSGNGTKVNANDLPFKTTRTFRMAGPNDSASAGNSGVLCRSITENILLKDSVCQHPPCSFNGIHQPLLESSLDPRADIYIFSYFYDRTSPLGMPHSFTLAELLDLTTRVCKGTLPSSISSPSKNNFDDAWLPFAAIPGALDELQTTPEWCLDLNFIFAILHRGYDMPLSRQVKIAKKIANNELGWCLGASIPLLDTTSGGWTCKQKSIN